MRTFSLLVLLFLITFCSSTSGYVSPEELIGTEWEYQDALRSQIEDISFSYGDLMVFNALDPTVLKLVQNIPPTTLQQSISSGKQNVNRSVRYRQPVDEPDELILELWQADTFQTSFKFYLPEQLIDPKEILATIGDGVLNVISAEGDTLQFRIDNEREEPRVFVIPEYGPIRQGNQERFATLNASDKRLALEYFEMKGIPTDRIWVFANSSTPGSFVLIEYSKFDSIGHGEIATAKIEDPAAATTLLENEIFYLLSHGRIHLNNVHDYQPGDKVSYKFEEEFLEKGLSIEQLAEVGFSFNADGTYDIFHHERSLATGRFRISPDRAYLILTNKRNSRYLKLSYEGRDKVTFQYPFQLKTPEPLGEKMISSYQLTTEVSFSEN